MAKIGVAGTTSWGTTLAIMLARRGHRVALWARREPEASALRAAGEHRRFLPGTRFPEGLSISASAEEVFKGCDLALIAVPSTTLRDNTRALAGVLAGVPAVVSATKGIEVGTGKRPSQLVKEELGPSATAAVGALSGPNLAREIAADKVSSATVAFDDAKAAVAAQRILNSRLFRVYTSDDVTGVELGGALKNIIAIGAGFIDGFGLGNNAKAAFITRGLHEITRLGVAMSARPETFAGLSGLGDLVATCYSGLSRNRYVGQELARGRALREIRARMDQIAEGVTTTLAASEMAAAHNVEMPITDVTRRVLFDDLPPREAIGMLMSRAPAAESLFRP